MRTGDSFTVRLRWRCVKRMCFLKVMGQFCLGTTRCSLQCAPDGLRLHPILYFSIQEWPKHKDIVRVRSCKRIVEGHADQIIVHLDSAKGQRALCASGRL